MTILIGHPAGNPNSYNAAAAYFEAGLLECFCVPWMPSARTLRVLSSIQTLRPYALRFGRRQFRLLSNAPKVQGRVGEAFRLALRTLDMTVDGAFDANNRWLMRTMARECRRSTVTAVHAYEDCSLWQFTEAKRLGKACVYDMPTCYYQAWEKTKVALRQKYSDWLSPDDRPTDAEGIRFERKRQEMAHADLTLVASGYVEQTIREYYPYKNIVRAPYGVDGEYWTPASTGKAPGQLRFIYAGQVSLRKGVPLLIEAWSKAQLRDADLVLVGSWALADDKRGALPPGVTWLPPCSSQELRDQYRNSDVFVFPSFSDGFGLVVLEAMACGLPIIASQASVGPEVITPGCGFVLPAGDVDQLVELLRWFGQHRGEIQFMGKKARLQAARWTWSNYRTLITRSVTKVL